MADSVSFEDNMRPHGILDYQRDYQGLCILSYHVFVATSRGDFLRLPYQWIKCRVALNQAHINSHLLQLSESQHKLLSRIFFHHHPVTAHCIRLWCLADYRGISLLLRYFNPEDARRSHNDISSVPAAPFVVVARTVSFSLIPDLVRALAAPFE
jgi:hypothetical protein